MFEQVSIIGIGLLGGSLARAIKARGLARRIVGCGRRPDRLKFALDNGIADAVDHDPVAASRDSDLVVISTPVSLIPEIIRSLNGHLRPGAIVTDMGSTKSLIVHAAEDIFPDSIHFVGGHPMAGSENAGIEASSENLFENALCMLTSSARTDLSSLQRLQQLWETLQCRVMILSPEDHDLLVAAASHLPHIVAVSLVDCIASLSRDREKILPLLAGGFRDTTRIASGSPEIWRDICLTNRDAIRDVLSRFSSAFTDISSTVSSAEPLDVESLFDRVKRFRDELPVRGRGALESDFEILVDVQDRPGVIGDIATALGSSSINIRNINVQHIREFGGGTMLITLTAENDVDRAVSLLSSLGFTARPRR